MTSVEITPAATAAQSKIEYLWNERVKAAERLKQVAALPHEVEETEKCIPSRVPEELLVPSELVDEFNEICDGWHDRKTGREYARSQQLLDIVYYTSGDTELRKWAASRLAMAARYEVDLVNSVLVEQIDSSMNLKDWDDRLWSIDDAIMQKRSATWADVEIKVKIMIERKDSDPEFKCYVDRLCRDIRRFSPEPA